MTSWERREGERREGDRKRKKVEEAGSTGKDQETRTRGGGGFEGELH